MRDTFECSVAMVVSRWPLLATTAMHICTYVSMYVCAQVRPLTFVGIG